MINILWILWGKEQWTLGAECHLANCTFRLAFRSQCEWNIPHMPHTSFTLVLKPKAMTVRKAKLIKHNSTTFTFYSIRNVCVRACQECLCFWVQCTNASSSSHILLLTHTNKNTDSNHISDTDKESDTTWNYGMNLLIRFYSWHDNTLAISHDTNLNWDSHMSPLQT